MMGRVLNPAMKKKKKIWIYINILLLQETGILFCIWKPLDFPWRVLLQKNSWSTTFLFSNFQPIKTSLENHCKDRVIMRWKHIDYGVSET